MLPLKSLTLALILAMTTAALSQTPSEPGTAPEPTLIAFEKIDRKIKKLPSFVGTEQRYGLLLFGLQGEKKVWMVMDRRNKSGPQFDTLHVDLNANGDLTEKGEQFEGKAIPGGVTFTMNRFVDPGTKAVHEDFVVTWRAAKPGAAEATRFKMKWRGGKISMGPFGPKRETYQAFTKTSKTAPIFVPGFDRPFQFEHWMCGTLKRGQSTNFKVFVGNAGHRTGSFFCVDDKFLGLDDSPVATLLYVDTGGKKRRVQVKLTERC